MEDDPWGSSADPWSKTNNDGATEQGANVSTLSLQEDGDLSLGSSLAVPARGNSLSDADPWASPVKSKHNAESIPSPIALLDTELPSVEVPDFKNGISVPEWATEERAELPSVPDLTVDISLPKVQWDTEDTADDNAWSAPKTTSLPASSPINDARPLSLVAAEQTPLPDDEDTHLEDQHSSGEQEPEDTWSIPHIRDDDPDVASVDLASFTQPPPRFVEENDSFNPFSQGDRSQGEEPEEKSRGFGDSSQDDEDDAFGGFGGFASGGIEDAHGQSGFASVTENESYGGWGNEENVQGFSGAWGSGSAGDVNEDDDETEFQHSSRNYNDGITDDNEGFHSVPSRGTNVATAEQIQEDEWEAERRKIASQEARAPIELITKLADKWKDVLHHVFTASKPLDTGKEVEDGLDPETMIRKDRLMGTLTELPDGMSIYVQPTQNTATWALYQEYLTTVKLDPSASVLAKAGAESAYRAARRKSQEDHDAWQARSRLGESGGLDPSLKTASALGQEAEGLRPKWSLWGRKASTPIVPLTTSGGGLLEVKGLSPNPTGTASDSQSRMGMQLASIPTSSRSTPPPIHAAESQMPSEHDLGAVDPAPSAVGRFLGRFRRPKTVTASVDVSNKDLELSQDDFSFLADVPALPTKANAGTVDLLSLDDARPAEQMASLEAMLNSTPLPLPPQLNPPPRPVASRGNSTVPQRLSVASNAPLQSASKSTSMADLFGDLDLGSAMAPNPSPSAPRGFGYDAYMHASNPPAAQQNQPAQATMLPKPLNARIESAHTGFDMMASFEDNVFGDFTTQSRTKTSSTFDDFGDFEEFPTNSKAKHENEFARHTSSPSIFHGAKATAPASRVGQSMTGGVQASPSKLDHSSAAKLVQTAALNPNKWPASRSPSIPALPPPTSANIRSPASVPAAPSGSRTGTPLNFDFLAAGPAMVAPPRSNNASPAISLLATSDTGSRSHTPHLSKGQGLSASDLSFFDSL